MKKITTTFAILALTTFAHAAPISESVRIFITDSDGVRAATQAEFKIGVSKPVSALTSEVLTTLIGLSKKTPEICHVLAEINDNGDLAISAIDSCQNAQ
jgi:hypothetical protein